MVQSISSNKWDSILTQIVSIKKEWQSKEEPFTVTPVIWRLSKSSLIKFRLKVVEPLYLIINPI